jgi:hypothetical protein
MYDLFFRVSKKIQHRKIPVIYRSIACGDGVACSSREFLGVRSPLASSLGITTLFEPVRG